jgi:phosphatidylglycerophosphatase A
LVIWAFLPESAWVHATAIALLFPIGVWSASAVGRYFRSSDPGPVVVDEVMGMLVTLFLVPVGWRGAAIGFLLFRVFDVLKPYPVNRLERLPGGLGVMADDAMAGVYANLTLRLAIGVTGVWVT